MSDEADQKTFVISTGVAVSQKTKDVTMAIAVDVV